MFSFKAFADGFLINAMGVTVRERSTKEFSLKCKVLERTNLSKMCRPSVKVRQTWADRDGSKLQAQPHSYSGLPTL